MMSINPFFAGRETKGRIYINGKDVTSVSPVNRRIGMVFQSYALFPHLTVAENLALGLRVRKISAMISINEWHLFWH